MVWWHILQAYILSALGTKCDCNDKSFYKALDVLNSLWDNPKFTVLNIFKKQACWLQSAGLFCTACSFQVLGISHVV